MITYLLTGAAALAAAIMTVILLGTAIAFNPWLIVGLVLFVKIAWPKKQKSSLDDDDDVDEDWYLDK